tara:strand:- start:8627 stop:9583 length:957 start_codon:yes stop_codon:yes gene_type:complete
MKKNILVAGGAGFIGTRLSNKLSKKYNVTVMDHFWFGDQLNENITKIKQDINKVKSEDLKGYDAVLFLAGLSNDPMAMYRPDLNFVENSATPTYLAFAAKEAGVKRFICASSCSVYGYTKNKTLNENSPVKPSYAYGISKLQCEKGVMILEDDNFKPILFRKGTVGGWSNKMRFDLVVNTMLMTALTKKKITVNSPKLWRPLVDIRDIIQAYELAIEANEDIAGVYNVAGGNYTIGQLGQMIQGCLKSRGYNTELEMLDTKDIRNYKVSISKIQDELGFEPNHNPEHSINEILDNINPEIFDFSQEHFYNIKTFKKLI